MKPNIPSIIEQVVNICTETGSVHEVILYGSRAKGTYMERSDIDIAIKGNNIDIEDIRDKIYEIDTLLKIDLVDIENCKNDLLKKEVEKYGIILYSKV